MERERHFVRIRDRQCPFCHEAVRGRVDLCSCEVCQTIHHSGCWEENGRACAAGCIAKVDSHQHELSLRREKQAEAAKLYRKDLRLSIYFFIFLLILCFLQVQRGGVAISVLFGAGFIGMIGSYLYLIRSRRDKIIRDQELDQILSLEGDKCDPQDIAK